MSAPLPCAFYLLLHTVLASCCSLLPSLKTWRYQLYNFFLTCANFSEISSFYSMWLWGIPACRKAALVFFHNLEGKNLLTWLRLPSGLWSCEEKEPNAFWSFLFPDFLGLGSPQASFPPPSTLLVSYAVLGPSPDPCYIQTAEGLVGRGIFYFPARAWLFFPYRAPWSHANGWVMCWGGGGQQERQWYLLEVV